MTAFPDLRVTMDGASLDGERAVYHWTLTGTDTGPGGNGKAVRISGHEEWTIGADGLIARSLGHFDEAEYRRQLESGARSVLTSVLNVRRGAAAGLLAIVALTGTLPGALVAQAAPPGCESAGIAVNGFVLGSRYRDRTSWSGSDAARVRYVGRGIYLRISADTIVSIGLEAPGVEICGLRVGHSRSDVAERWGSPRSQLPAAWIYGDSVGRPGRWMAVVYFGNPGSRPGGPADSVARIAVLGRGAS
jgi:hypothetical protein